MAIRRIKQNSLANLPTATKQPSQPEEITANPIAEELKVEFILVAGGGGGGAQYGGGGGAGGAIVSELGITEGNEVSIEIGLGGTAGLTASPKQGGQGSNSVLGAFTAIGGGGGGGNGAAPTNGGSGGGVYNTAHIAGSGTLGQGYGGGGPSHGGGGGGGGAGSKGLEGTFGRSGGYFWAGTGSGNGGRGIIIPFLKYAVYVAGGGAGGGAPGSWSQWVGSAGLGGGGTTNTGGGGNGGSNGGNGGSGGSGVIYLNVPKTFKPVFSAGVTYSVLESLDSNFNVYAVTAAGPTDTVKFEKVSSFLSVENRKLLKVKYSVRGQKNSTRFASVAAKNLSEEVTSTVAKVDFKKENVLETALNLLSAKSSSLTRTFTAAGNRKTWTYSCWIKMFSYTTHTLFEAEQDSTSYTRIFVDSTGFLNFVNATTTPTSVFSVKSIKQLKLNVWTNVVVCYDSSNDTAVDRVKIYVNGQREQISFTNFPAKDLETFISSTVAHKIQINGAIAEVNFLDGLVKPAQAFGEVDPVTGLWLPKTGVKIDYLVVAGGGGGGSTIGGGGGAGGLLHGTKVCKLNVLLSLTVGAGGLGGVHANNHAKGQNGENSVFADIITAGGGAGGGGTDASIEDQAGQNGGSGGGANALSLVAGLGNTPATSPSQGNKGGRGIATSCGGGGGGAGVRGTDGRSDYNTAGRGGDGFYYCNPASFVFTPYAGGGAGAGQGGRGGAGGGASGQSASGTVNTGGGGAGGASTGNGGNGGSGIIILTYPNTVTATFSSGVAHTTKKYENFTTSIITAAGLNDTVMFY